MWPGNVEPVRIATAAGQVDYQCPEAVTDAVHAAAGGQRRPHDIDGAWFAVGDDWYFECSYLVDDDAPEDAGISYRAFRRDCGGPISGSWKYGDRAAAVRAIDEIIETLTETPCDICGIRRGEVQPRGCETE